MDKAQYLKLLDAWLDLGRVLFWERAAPYTAIERVVREVINQSGEIDPPDRPITDLHFSLRVRKSLARHGVDRLGQLVNMTADELLELHSMGRTSLHEIQEKLGSLGLRLKNE